MSQYFEFQAVDRALTKADQDELRNLSSRAEITSSSFRNSYEWGSFRGNARSMMQNWFDLHLFLANWGTRRLMFGWPAHLVDRHELSIFLDEVDCARLHSAGQRLILDINIEELESEDCENGSDWLATIAPLRSDVLTGDLRLLYLLWLSAVEADVFEPDTCELLPGLGPITGALEAFANFLQIDRDLVAAAAERVADPLAEEAASPVVARSVIAGMSESEKLDMLGRLFDGDVHIGHELRALVRQRTTMATVAAPATRRTVGNLRARAEVIRQARLQALAAKAAAEKKLRAEEAERSYRARLDAITRRGESVWREVEGEIALRSAAGYDEAIRLLRALDAISVENGTRDDFNTRLRAIRSRHARKALLIEKLLEFRLENAVE